MAKHLIVYGHGNGDPGAIGDGTNERDFNRKVLHPYIKKWTDKSKHTFVFYDVTGNKNLFDDTARGWGLYSMTSKTYASVTEIHEDAAGSSATGGHTIVNSSLSADQYDLSLATIINTIVGWWGSVKNSKGISYRNNLLNCNVAANRGINYRLMELGFITNSSDMAKIRNSIDIYAKGIVEGITGENLGGESKLVNKANTKVYYDDGKFFKAKRDLPTYIDDHFKKHSQWVFSKGSVFGISKIYVGANGNTHAHVKVNGGTIRVTLNKNWVEKVN